MRRGPRCALLLACLLASAMAPPALAQSVELARQAEATAREAYRRGDYQRAADGFAEAHRLSPSAATKYNEAQAWYKARRDAPAADAYDEALRMGTLDVAATDNSRARLAELERKLGVIVLEHPAGAVVDLAHAQERRVPARVHLAPGEHTAVLRTQSGREHRRVVHVEAGRTTRLDIPIEPVATPSSAPRASAAPLPRPKPARTEPATDGGTQRAIGWSCIALGGAATAVAIVLGVRAHDAIADFEATGNQDPELRDEAVDLRAWTNVAAGLAVLGVGAGAVFLITAPRNEPRGAGLRLEVGWASAGVSTAW